MHFIFIYPYWFWYIIYIYFCHFARVFAFATRNIAGDQLTASHYFFFFPREALLYSSLPSYTELYANSAGVVNVLIYSNCSYSYHLRPETHVFALHVTHACHYKAVILRSDAIVCLVSEIIEEIIVESLGINIGI